MTEIVCLLRDPDPLSRLQQKFKDRHLDLSNDSKLSVLPSDLSSPKLGLTDPTYQGLLSKVTHIIHCAWPVTFQLALGAFESSIQGVHNLLQLSLDVDLATPARFLFCSSISTALGDCPGGHNAEAPIENLEQTSLTGYAQSKLVSEWIVQAAVEKAGAAASILRIGQIVGDTKTGWWNDSEMFPLIIRSALNMGILPELGPACEWLPVDTLAEGIIQIAHLDARAAEEPDLSPGRLPSSQGERHLVYNLVSPHKISWTTEILPALSSAGLSFRPVSLVTWVHQLRSLSLLDSSHNSDDNEDGASLPVAADPTQNPALKLIDFFEGIFLAGNAAGKQEIDFDTAKAREAAAALRQAPHVVTSGLLAKMLEAWMKKWRKD